MAAQGKGLLPSRLQTRVPVAFSPHAPRMRFQASQCQSAIKSTPLMNRQLQPMQRQFGSRPSTVQVRAFDSTSTHKTSWNPVEVVKREQGLQSNRLPTNLRESVTAAVEQLSYRVTVGDVAGRAGVKFEDADDALKALAYDSLAALEVSEQGDVVYNFPRNFKSAIQNRSLILSAQPALKNAWKIAKYLVRVAFGTALVSSIAIVWLAITVLLSSRGSDRDERRDNRGGGMGYYNGYSSYNGGGGGARLFFNLTDLLIYFDPNYSSVGRQRVAQGSPLTFIESIFSFVFGDGDPNAEFDAERWSALGQLIQDRGGVMTAEEMAPFLDPPANHKEGPYPDESFVLPALIRFGGEAVVDENTGQLIYKFPGLQATAVTQEWVRGRDGRPVQVPVSGAMPYAATGEVPQEKPWELTAATAGQLLGVVGLGILNVAGVVTLSGLLADPQARYALTYQGLGWITNIMPGLQLYAATFFGIPALRIIFNLQTNNAIAQRNGARIQASNLFKRGGKWLREKLDAARSLGTRRTVRKSDAIFTTEQDTGKQIEESAQTAWDEKFQTKQSRQPEPATWSDRVGGPGTARQRAREVDGWK